MHLKLCRLELKNFKGATSAKFDFAGEDANIYGANATGKTTLMDAFLWLFFGKDSLNHADFDVKPLSSTGESEHGLEHEVAGVLDLDGKSIDLRKVLVEKWTKKRGSATAEFTGHTITYFIDGVPKTEREYKAAIASICDEMTFRLLTNPRHFSESMKWEDRRKVLLDVCGDITDTDVIASSADLAGLPGILKGRSLEDHRKVIASEKTRLKEELEKIPIQHAEQERILSDTANLDPKSIRSRMAHLTMQKREQEEALATLRHGGEIAAKTKALREIEGKIIDLENKERKAKQKIEEGRDKEIRSANKRLIDLCANLGTSKRNLENLQRDITATNESIVLLRDAWVIENQKTLSYEDTLTCPACGQDLPSERVEVARRNALADFNAAKAAELTRINETGKKMKDQLAAWKAEAEKIQTGIPKIEKEIAAAESEIGELNQPMPAIPENPDRQKLLEGKTVLESAISELQLGNHDGESEILSLISEFETEILGQQKLLASIDATEDARKRITYLERKERELSAEYERLEGELSLTEKFVRRKVELLEEKINSRFRIARFKLFKQQINGGLAECCETTINGVLYWSANNAARTQSGLDVCNILAEHYGFHPPVWIDNRESITEIPDMDCQVISLIVSEQDKSLRFETVNNERKAA